MGFCRPFLNVEYLYNMSYIDNMIANCELARSARPKRTISIEKDGDFSVLNGILKAVYIIKEVDGDNEKTFRDFCEYKSRKERACPRANSPSETMYVGSSTTGIFNRIKQHTGIGPRTTYSLNLKEWFSGKYIITVMEYDVTSEVIQIIEDSISFDIKPAFGKMGCNNK